LEIGKRKFLHFLFSNPSSRLLSSVINLKKHITDQGLDRLIGIQIREKIQLEYAGQEAMVDQFLSCATYWGKNDSKTAFFLATDTPSLKAEIKRKLGNLFYFEEPSNAILDWYMLGECDTIIGSAASSFGISAADRGGLDQYPERFHVGSLTSCTNPESQYYLEKIYVSPLEILNLTGTMKWLQYIH